MNKIHKLLLILLAFFSPLLWGGAGGGVQAQTPQVLDSLNRLLKNSKPDTNRVKILIELGNAYIYSNSDTAIHYHKKALALVQKLKFTIGEAAALNNISFSLTEKQEYVSALQNAKNSLKIATKGNHLLEKGNALLRLADLNNVLGNIDEAVFYFKEAESVFKQLKNNERLATVYNNLGGSLTREGYFSPDVQSKDSLYKLALEYTLKSVEIGRATNDELGLTIGLTNLSDAYLRLRQDSLALKYLSEAEKLAIKTNNLRERRWVKVIRARLLFGKGKVDEAEKLMLEVLEESKRAGTPLRGNFYETLSDIYVQKKDFAKAYQYRVIFQQIREKAMYNPVVREAVQTIRKNEEAEKRRIEQAEAEKERQIQQLYLLSVGGGLLLVLLILGLVYRNNLRQRKTNRLLHEKNDEITQQSEELQQQTEELHQQAEELAAQRDSLERANENVMLLSEIGKEITSTLNVKEIIEISYEKVNALMDATVFMIGIFNESKQQIEMPIIIEKGETHPFLTYHLSETERPAVWCFTHRKELVWNDVYADYPKVFEGKTLPPVKSGDQTNSIIYLPLLSKGKAIGVISVQSFQKDAYSEYQVHMLKNIAIYTTIAVENAENLHALADEKKNLESTNQELEALTEELRQQSNTVLAQRDKLAESSTQLEELLEESQTQKETLEIKNQEMEALQSTKDLMISAVNHDLRNPLNPILNYSQPDYPKFTEKERLAMIHDRAKMMFALINDIMDVYRADKLQLQPQTASLYRAVSEAIAAISEAKTDLPEIINEVPENAQAVFEFKYIERVLENLLSNAVKYSENKTNGGKIRFYTETTTNEQGKKYHRIAIQDNGMGIPKEKFEEIFLPFTNPNAKDIGAAKSVGIGLTFCKTIVEAHHSQIFIESEVGKGTTFAFDLPMVEERLAQTTNNQSNGEFALTASDKVYLAEFVPKLAVFQEELFNADVRKVLKSIEANGSENLKTWKQHLEQSIDEMDEERFGELLGMV